MFLTCDFTVSGEVSAVLSLSRKTVDTYRSRIKQKLGIPHLPGLVKFAIREGLTSAD
jgi:DNA-binding CsgD family transcriptional regulator